MNTSTVKTFANASNAKRGFLVPVCKKYGKENEKLLRQNFDKFAKVVKVADKAFHGEALENMDVVIAELLGLEAPKAEAPKKEVKRSPLMADLAAQLAAKKEQPKAEAPATKPVETEKPKVSKAKRIEQNGIKRPLSGVCAAVWDVCDTIYADNLIPNSKFMRTVAEEKGWNLNNTLIEFYQWRKFMGIMGRNPVHPNAK